MVLLSCLRIGLLVPALAAAPWVEAQGLWDQVKEGATRTYERGGELVKEGAQTGRDWATKGLDVGKALTDKGVEVGKQSVEDTINHFDRKGTPEEIRAQIDQMAFDTLDRLFSDDPEAHLLFDTGFGYGVFDVRQVSFTVTAGYGYGVAVGADEAERIYMKVATGGLEVSAGVGGFVSQWVVLFEDESAFRRFVEQGYDASAEAVGLAGPEQADLSARYQEGVSFYRVTKAGLKLAATVSGTRFWPDAELN